MDSYLCFDSEELFRACGKRKAIAGSELVGIFEVYDLAQGGLIGNVLDSLRSGEEVIWALLGACRGGHKELVSLMLSKDTNGAITGLNEACKYGHIEIVLMLDQKIESLGGYVDWSWHLISACEGGHKALIKLIVQKIGGSGDRCLECHELIEEH
jgi:hypothetical protein